ncbi:unnamed protein product [Boreogadus saida]
MSRSQRPVSFIVARNRRTEERTITYISGNFQERRLYSAFSGQPESHLRKLCACAPQHNGHCRSRRRPQSATGELLNPGI